MPNPKYYLVSNEDYEEMLIYTGGIDLFSDAKPVDWVGEGKVACYGREFGLTGRDNKNHIVTAWINKTLDDFEGKKVMVAITQLKED